MGIGSSAIHASRQSLVDGVDDRVSSILVLALTVFLPTPSSCCCHCHSVSQVTCYRYWLVWFPLFLCLLSRLFYCHPKSIRCCPTLLGLTDIGIVKFLCLIATPPGGCSLHSFLLSIYLLPFFLRLYAFRARIERQLPAAAVAASVSSW